MSASLVGSEMCIRDSPLALPPSHRSRRTLPRTGYTIALQLPRDRAAPELVEVAATRRHRSRGAIRVGQ
eukprot:11187085-Alexandrium_andersonii.AAC.1